MKEKLEFVYLMAKYSNASFPQCETLMRLGATHIRLETNLTNGHKRHTQVCDLNTRRGMLAHCTCSGEFDPKATETAEAKRDRADAKMEAICKELGCAVEYGALTVRVVFPNGREACIP